MKVSRNLGMGRWNVRRHSTRGNAQLFLKIQEAPKPEEPGTESGWTTGPIDADFLNGRHLFVAKANHWRYLN